MATMTFVFLLALCAVVHSNTVRLSSPLHMGFPCRFGDKCETGAKCLPLNGMWVCLPEQDFSRDGSAGLFGECNKHLKCKYGRKCVSGVCVDDPNRQCQVTNVPWQNPCSDYTTCQGGYCHAGIPGSPCRTPWRQRRCLPGLRCVGAKENGPANAPGRCTRVAEGSRCVFTAECPTGLVCSSRWRCERSPTGAPCSSDFWCPIDHACVGGVCKPGKQIGWDKVPTEGRGRPCKTELDCPVSLENISMDARCVNYVCLPGSMGEKCDTKRPCGVGTYCKGGICVEATRGDRCTRGTGTCYAGSTCEFWRSKTCISKGIGRKCQTLSTCPPGMSCKGGVCVLGGNGDYCVAHAHCKEGLYCVKRACTTPRNAFGA